MLANSGIKGYHKVGLPLIKPHLNAMLIHSPCAKGSKSMIKTIMSVCVIVVAHVAIPVFAAGQADKIFDKAFLQSIKNVRFYEQIVKIVGVPGEKVGNSSIKIPGEKYHWNGRENTSFNIRVISGKLVDANVVTPDGHFISLEGNGELTDLGK